VNKAKEKEVKKDAGAGKNAGKDLGKNEGKTPREPAIPARMRIRYLQKTVPALMKRMGYTNIMQVPCLEKIVVNMGMGAATADAKILDDAVVCLRDISGQKPVVTKARKAISNFKLRENQPIGCKVTLRGSRMWEFFDRLVSIAIPRIRDFRGLSRKSFDGQGNYTLGIKEQIVFLEIDRDKVSRISGMDITICTTAKNNEGAFALLEELGMPFRKITDKEEKEADKKADKKEDKVEVL
jgi:large subunit ribosomal protein L5